MDKCFAKSLCLGSCLIALASGTESSTLTGRVQTLRVNSGFGESVRVGIQLSGNTDCPLGGWFAFERADTGVSRLWVELANTAIQSGKQLTVTGTGTCDEWSVEGVSNIDLHG